MKQIRVLVVDDSAFLRRTLPRLLETEPEIKVIGTATNGREAVEMAKKLRPDVITMDVIMPVMDGREATKRIRAVAEGAETAIIAVTASVMEDEREAVLATGADDFIRKPIREEVLFDAIRRHVGLEYVYAEEDADADAGKGKVPALSPEAFAGIPEETAAEMRQATINLDLERLQELINEVAEYNAETAQALRGLASRYAYDELSAFFGEGEDSK